MAEFPFFYLEIQENYYHPELQRSRIGRSMELDIFLPKERLAFEYQGEHHYRDLYSIGSGWNQKERDEEKKTLCRGRQITLIEIPYWWDKQISSLAATIQKERPDLLTDSYVHFQSTPIQQHSEQGEEEEKGVC